MSPSSQDCTFQIPTGYVNSSQPSNTAALPPRNQQSSSSIPNFNNIYFPIASSICNTHPAGCGPASQETDIDSININAQTRFTGHANVLSVPSPASVLQQADSLCEVLRTALTSTNATAQSNTTQTPNRALRLNINTSIEMLGSRNHVVMSSSANSQPANPGQIQAPSSSGPYARPT